MRLKDYIALNRISQKAFAERSGISRGMICLLIAGKTWPSRETARRIAIASKGEVTAADFQEIEAA